jgi:hypothetical protein
MSLGIENQSLSKKCCFWSAVYICVRKYVRMCLNSFICILQGFVERGRRYTRDGRGGRSDSNSQEVYMTHAERRRRKI